MRRCSRAGLWEVTGARTETHQRDWRQAQSRAGLRGQWGPPTASPQVLFHVPASSASTESPEPTGGCRLSVCRTSLLRGGGGARRPPQGAGRAALCRPEEGAPTTAAGPQPRPGRTSAGAVSCLFPWWMRSMTASTAAGVSKSSARAAFTACLAWRSLGETRCSSAPGPARQQERGPARPPPAQK